MDPQAAVLSAADFGQAFAVWAAVVGIIGAAIVYELARVRAELKMMGVQLNTYIVTMERRVTAIETHLQIRNGFRASHGEAEPPYGIG